MQETGKLGHTVLVVSHDMQAVSRLCERAVLLENGHVVQDGSAFEVVRGYLTSGVGSLAEHCWDNFRTAPGDDIVRLKSVRVLGPEGCAEHIDVTDAVGIEMEYWVLQPCVRPVPN